jgi:4-hydroxy-tetrahydrodipicolinate synthase
MMAISGLIPPISTPLAHGEVDVDSLGRLVQALAPHVDGYLVGGSVGEHPSLTVEERLTALRVVARQKQARHRLVFSIGDNALPNVRRLSQAAMEAGADLVVLSVPNYFANTLPGLEAYLHTVAGFSDRELCLYDNPIASHTVLSVADIVALAKAEPKFTHIKVTDLTLGKIAALRTRTNLTIHCGDDAVLWNQLTEGPHGAMVALPLFYPTVARTVWDAVQRGAMDEAAAAYRPVSHFIHVALGAPDYVTVLKVVLAAQSIIATDEVRLPLLPLAQTRRDEVLRALDSQFAITSPTDSAGVSPREVS